jgi:hypothetical protein
MDNLKRAIAAAAALAMASMVQALITEAPFGFMTGLRLALGIVGFIALEDMLSKPIFETARLRFAAAMHGREPYSRV